MSKEFVDAISKGDNVTAQDAFKTAMMQKVGDKLENEREAVAQTFVSSRQNLTPEEENVLAKDAEERENEED
jgi:hypothetical protein